MIQVGDHVKMRQPAVARGTANVTYEILEIPLRNNMAPTWWEMKGDTDGLTYIFDGPIVFTVVP